MLNRRDSHRSPSRQSSQVCWGISTKWVSACVAISTFCQQQKYHCNWIFAFPNASNYPISLWLAASMLTLKCLASLYWYCYYYCCYNNCYYWVFPPSLYLASSTNRIWTFSNRFSTTNVSLSYAISMILHVGPVVVLTHVVVGLNCLHFCCKIKEYAIY